MATALSSTDWSWVLPTFALITAFSSAHELVFATARGARLHDGLARDFLALEQELLRAGSELTRNTLIELQARRLDIEAASPPLFRVLDAICHDELITALGYDDSERSNVTLLQRLLCNFLDIRANALRKQGRHSALVSPPLPPPASEQPSPDPGGAA